MKVQERLTSIRDNIFFEIFVVFVIIVSGVIIGIKTYDSVSSSVISTLEALDYSITIFFLAEIVLRILAEKKKIDFFKSGWNVFDFVIISLSVIPASMLESVIALRLLRLIRVLRLITFIPQFKVIIQSLFTSIPRVFYVLLFMLINFYIFAVAGTTFFSEIDQLRWGNVGLSMLTLFQTATLEGWPDLMYEAFSYNSYSWIFFVVFIILNSLILMNMIIGVIIDVVVRENDEELPENIALLEKINKRLDLIERKIK